MNLIKSISYNQHTILKNIFDLHCKDKKPVIDATYGRGNFYNKRNKNILPEPNIKFDIINHGIVDLTLADCTNLPLQSNTCGVVVFDPPFLVAVPRDKDISNLQIEGSNLITKRFGYFMSIPLLWKFYKDSMVEFYRVLYNKGVLIFKCQDTVSSGKQYLSHIKIINVANSLGFYVKDLFILMSKNRLISSKHKNQQHARKFHSYFIVLEKSNRNVRYTSSANYS